MSSVSIEMAGTDVSSDGSYIGLQILTPANVWETVFEVAGVVINRDVGPGRPVREIGPQLVALPDIEAQGVRLIMKGNGWFPARNIVVVGR